MSENTKPWTDTQLANLNQAWFAGYSMRYCDKVSGERCITLRVRHVNIYDPLKRIIWGWAGGSATSGLLWDVNNKGLRADRTGLPLSKAEADFIELIAMKRHQGGNQKLELITPDYMAAVLNRMDLDERLAEVDNRPKGFGVL